MVKKLCVVLEEAWVSKNVITRLKLDFGKTPFAHTFVRGLTDAGVMVVSVQSCLRGNIM
jgi:hypothetical protein